MAIKTNLKFLNQGTRQKALLIVLLPVVYLFLPVWLEVKSQVHTFTILFFFYLVNGLIAFYIYSTNNKKIRNLRLRRETLEEEINLANYQNKQGLVRQAAFKEKIEQYLSLKQVIETINTSLTLESIAEHLTSVGFILVGRGHGTCTLYLMDERSHELSLFKAKKEDKRIIIKAKQGDIFDHWVLRHASPLFIEDSNKDFRFDPGKFKVEDMRPVSSLISASLLSGGKFLGLLRLDHPEKSSYSQDDLRFLVTISDLGAVALENGLLYEHTEELAIRDGLTSLFNKGHFSELLKLEFKKSIRHESIFSLLMIDIDHFKNYNDQFGHVAGDILLRSLSQNILQSLRDKDALISRFGGEEFCVILRGADKQEAKETAELLRKIIEETKIILRRQETYVTVSIGCTTMSKATSDEAELIIKADRAMYLAKKSGRNRVVAD